MGLLKSFKLTPRNKKWAIFLTLCGVSSFGVYKVYNLSSVSRKRNGFVKLFASIISVVKTISDCSEIFGVVSSDMKQFLASDHDQVPNSLNQLSKLAVSDEFSKSLTHVFQAATLGVIQGYKKEQKEEKKAESSGFKDHVFDKLMTESGTGFVSVVVGSFARNLVMGYESGLKVSTDVSTDLPELVDVLSRDESKLVIGDLIKMFVSIAVAVYLDRSTSVNVSDGLFSRMNDAKHEKHVKDIVVCVCSGAVETLIKTSHQVLTS